MGVEEGVGCDIGRRNYLLGRRVNGCRNRSMGYVKELFRVLWVREKGEKRNRLENEGGREEIFFEWETV